MDELISVIVPVYKVEKYLETCILSILHQTYTNLEIILVDDGSPDSCPDICEKYKANDKRIHVIHEENGGLSKARNTGMMSAKGELIAFVDSDDFLDERYLEILHGHLKRTEADIAICSWTEVRENETEPKLLGTDAEKSPQLFDRTEALRALFYQVPFDSSAWGKLYKRSLLKGIFFPEGKLYEDTAVMYRIMEKAGVICYTPYRGYAYLQRRAGIMLRPFSKDKMDLIDFTDTNEKYMLERYPQLRLAVLSRTVRANLHIYMQIPAGREYTAERKRICQNLKKRRREVLLDKRARKGTRLALLATYPGFWTIRVLRRLKFLGKK